MAPPSFTKVKVALLEPSLSLSTGTTGVMQGASHARGCGGKRREINLEEKERRWCSDRGRQREAK